MISPAELDFPTFSWSAVPLREITLAPWGRAVEISRVWFVRGSRGGQSTEKSGEG
jgi:hypothetical protein